MNKVLTIGLAAATLMGGVAATSGAAQAADWNHGGHYQSGHDRGGRDHYRGGERNDRRWDRGHRGYGYAGGCHTYRTWNPYWHRYTVRTRCF
ncbi:MAG TPA: hypothetical protein VIJ94_12520 [Caulobacteraceae bacterium]